MKGSAQKDGVRMVPSKARQGRTEGRRGYTLVELLIVIFIMAVVAAAVYTLFARQQKTYTTQDMVAEMQQNARAAVDMMVRELRMAGYDPNSTRPAGARIVQAGAQGIRFTCDLDGDGNTGGLNENITYELQFDQAQNLRRLRRGTGTGTPSFSTVLENVVSFNLEYMIIADGKFRGLGAGTDDGDPSGGPRNGTIDEPGELILINMQDAPSKRLCDQSFCSAACDNCLLGIRVVRVTMTVQTPYADLNSPTGRFPTYRLVTDVAMRNLSYIDSGSIW